MLPIKKLSLPSAGLFGEESLTHSSVQEIGQNGGHGAAVLVVERFCVGCKTGKEKGNDKEKNWFVMEAVCRCLWICVLFGSSGGR